MYNMRSISASRLATFKSEVVSGSKLSLLAKWEGQVKSHLSDDPYV